MAGRRGANLVYLRDRQQIAAGPGANYIHITQTIGSMNGGMATALEIGRMTGPTNLN